MNLPVLNFQVLQELFDTPWSELQREAWAVRLDHHHPELVFAVPGTKHYDGKFFTNREEVFVQISVTGRNCALKCAHCNGRLLESMLPVESEQELINLGKQLLETGTRGVLISGGSDRQGRVPLKRYFSGIRYLKQAGMKVIVHSGLIDWETAEGLKTAGVDQVLLDIIGNRDTIRQVYHLDKVPEDYGRCLSILNQVGLPMVPHIVAGLHFGRWGGELEALAAISAFQPAGIVIVVLTPLSGTQMAHVVPPAPEAVGKLVAVARIINPDVPLMLGCALPPRPAKDLYQEAALKAGVNGIAFPTDSVVAKARKLGLNTRFHEFCCSLGSQYQMKEGRKADETRT